MSADQFGTYAKFYDLLYKDKDYAKEAEFIHYLVTRHSSKPKEELRLLDMACGTGRHLLELAALGYCHLTGSDMSPGMIAEARRHAAGANRRIGYYNYSFQEGQRIPGKFDVVTSLFSAVNYIVAYEDQLQSFSNIHSLLEAGGLFIFDYWNGNAVVRDYSPVRVLRKQLGNSDIIRTSKTSIDMVQQQATVTFSCQYMENDQKLNEFHETHHLHYYFFSEMENLLHSSGFKVVQRLCFMKLNAPVDQHDWNISIVAQKSK